MTSVCMFLLLFRSTIPEIRMHNWYQRLAPSIDSSFYMTRKPSSNPSSSKEEEFSTVAQQRDSTEEVATTRPDKGVPEALAHKRRSSVGSVGIKSHQAGSTTSNPPWRQTSNLDVKLSSRFTSATDTIPVADAAEVTTTREYTGVRIEEAV